MGLGGAISNLLSLSAKLLPTVNSAPSSSWFPPAVDQNRQIEAELKKLMRMLERIKATLYDAEQREITELAVKQWLKELKGVAYDAEDVLGEYHYEVLRAQVEARDACPPDSRKRKAIQVPHDMLHEIQQIRSRFDEIANDRVALQLSDGDGPRRCNNELQIAPTSHFVVESNIFGRESEKEKLIELLFTESDGVSVVTIVGMGGIGKTTLAQLVYNDPRIRQRFDKFGWICVSDEFNVERHTKELVECITGNGCSLTNLSVLQEKIQRVISGKRVLLVLDDVWNENDNLWDIFKAPFMSAAFAKILVTTRNDNVGRIMQTETTFNLGYLSAEQCWLLFEHYAFGGVKQNKNPELVKIGKQIMNKCGLLPLAVKSIASLLRLEAEEESWRDILENELWESNSVSNKIFPSLQISYARLPTHLKPCFLYCSMFPKDYHYDVEYMMELWMSQGFIESKEKKKSEKIGFDYVQQLCERSFFEPEIRFDGSRGFRLHDIVHDLAQLNSENCCYSIEVGKLSNFPNVIYHLYIARYGDLRDPIVSNKFTSLRTLISSYSQNNFFTTFDLSMTPKLRALDLSLATSEFLSSIGHLKHLRFLSLSNMSLETLPECICSLYSLQKLTLTECLRLKELPRKIVNLISLEELIIHRCDELEVLPESLCQLKTLRKLCFIKCVQLEVLPSDLGSLTNLQTLEIMHTGVSYLPESLCQLKALGELCLIDCWLQEELPIDLGDLTNLQTLEIRDTGVSYFPESLCQLKALRKLCLIDCWLLKELPIDLGDLTNLQTLEIRDTGVSYLPESLCQLKALRKLCLTKCVLTGEIVNLISLEELIIKECDNLQVLPKSLCQLKALRKLCLIECWLLEALPSDLGVLTNLQTLEIRDTGVTYLPPSLSKFVGIQPLKVALHCETIGWLNDFPDLGGTLCVLVLEQITNLTDVQCANIVSMHNLEQLILSWGIYEYWCIDDSVLELQIESGHNVLPKNQSCFSEMLSLQPHSNLRKLTIQGYRDITFPEWIGSLCKLKYLKIRYCDSLQILKAEWLPLELEELEIYICHQLVSIPGIQKLKSLVKLSIYECENMRSFMGPSLELTMCTGEGSYRNSLLGLTNLPSLRRLGISFCHKLQASADELPPVQPCNVEVSDCPGLKEWCLQHGINYKGQRPEWLRPWPRQELVLLQRRQLGRQLWQLRQLGLPLQLQLQQLKQMREQQLLERVEQQLSGRLMDFESGPETSQIELSLI